MGEITVKLHPIPETKSVAICQFPSIEEASKAVIKIIQSGLYFDFFFLSVIEIWTTTTGTEIGKVELLDEVMIRAVNMNSNLGYKELPTLFFELSGTRGAVKEQEDIVRKITTVHRGSNLVITSDEKGGIFVS